MLGITAVRNRSRRRGGTSPVTRARVAGVAGAGAAAAPPLACRGCLPPCGALPPWGALPPFGAFGFAFSSASAMVYTLSMNRPFAFDDAALSELLRRTLMLFDHVEVLDEHATLVLEHAQDLAALPALLARHHHHRVTLPHVRVCHDGPQMTSGAREMILVNCRSRSSRATGPKIRVPTGLSSVFTRTTALRSKRM